MASYNRPKVCVQDINVLLLIHIPFNLTQCSNTVKTQAAQDPNTELTAILSRCSVRAPTLSGFFPHIDTVIFTDTYLRFVAKYHFWPLITYSPPPLFSTPRQAFLSVDSFDHNFFPVNTSVESIFFQSSFNSLFRYGRWLRAVISPSGARRSLLTILYSLWNSWSPIDRGRPDLSRFSSDPVLWNLPITR